MSFLEYVLENGVPDRVICVDSSISCKEVSKDNFYLPIITGMKIDHVQVDMDENCTIAFLRCPDGIKAV